MNLFDHIKQIQQIQDPNYFDDLDDQEKKSFGTYMIQRFMSMNEEYIPLINLFSKYNQNIPYTAEMYYKVLISFIPKSNKFLRYIKKKGKTIPNWLLELFVKEYQISKYQAEEYYKLVDKKFLKVLLKRYGTEKKKYREIGLKFE